MCTLYVCGFSKAQCVQELYTNILGILFHLEIPLDREYGGNTLDRRLVYVVFGGHYE